MAFVKCTITWEDNSNGAENETGQELQIYTDSPSFTPDIPIDYSVAKHPWMLMPLIAPGVTTTSFLLEAPFTFVTWRIRQYNANGFGLYESPQGQTFQVAQVANPLVPPAPTNYGFNISAGTVIDPEDPPEEPPPDIEPPPDEVVSSTYSWPAQFGSTQGLNQWSYRDTLDNIYTFNATTQLWEGVQQYSGVWAGGFHPGATAGTIVRWTAPLAGVVAITGAATLYNPTSGGANFKINHNATEKDNVDLTTTTPHVLAEGFSVAQDDTIDFIVSAGVALTNDSVGLSVTIGFTTDGSTPQVPSVSSLSPATASLNVGGVTTLTVSLSSAPAVATTVTLNSSDPTKATVPASIVLPIGQANGLVTVTGAAAGSSTITATANSTSQQSVITVSNPSSSTWPNAPAGWSILTDEAHNAIVENGWTDVYNTTGFQTTIVTDATAPVSPSNVVRQRIPQGLIGGNGGGGGTHFSFPSAKTAAYHGFVFKTDSNYENHPVMTKIAWIHTRLNNVAQMNQFFLAMHGQNSFYITANYQNSDIDNSHLFGGGPVGTIIITPNGNGGFSRGQWIQVEWLLIPSTTTTARNGILRVWINGVSTISVSNLNTGAVLPDAVSYITVWGGTGTTKTRESYLYYDHTRVYTP